MSLLSTRRDGFATAMSMSKEGPSAYALEVNQALLKEDDDLLRQTFLSVFRHHHPQLANKVDVIFALSQAWCMSESDDDFDMLVKRLETLKPDEHILVCVWVWGRGWSACKRGASCDQVDSLLMLGSSLMCSREGCQGQERPPAIACS